jgi:hypothetical protein
MQSVLQTCIERADEWGLQVQGRLNTVNDLPAVDAVYHHQCYKRFRTDSHASRQIDIAGRPTDKEKRKTFEELCSWLEDGSDGELHSLDELRRHMTEKSGNEDWVYGTKQLKNLLFERYGDNVFFAEQKGLKNVVCFRSMASAIINAKWYED